MKTKIVMKVWKRDAKSRWKAYKEAACFPGVQRAARLEQDKIELIGDLNAIDLGRRLRKKVGAVDLISMIPIPEAQAAPDSRIIPIPEAQAASDRCIIPIPEAHAAPDSCIIL